MNRAAIYARYSTDLQTEKSVEDQIALCRAYAERNGLDVVAVYDDRAISGASTVQRTGWRSLMAAAGERRFDVVIAEDVDRIARDEADYHAAKKRLVFAGIAIHTAHTGPISGIEGSVRAMMSAYFLENLAHKVRRGLAGVVRSGRHAGGLAYGYRPVAGKPGELVIVEAEKAVILRIFTDYAGGASPRDIAGALNREGIAPPRGRAWNASTINGSRQRGTGILNNELYRGRLVWNRVHMVKDPDTGRRISRINADAAHQVVDVPQLRIVPQDLAEAADARRTDRVRTARHRAQPLHLLSGMLRCGICGSGMSVHDRDKTGRARIRCSRQSESGTCEHARRYYLDDVERVVLEGLRDELRDPALIRHMVATYEEERRRLAGETRSGRARLEQKLGEVTRSIERLVDALASGLATADSVKGKLLALEADKARLSAELAEPVKTSAIAIHPKAVTSYLAEIDRLSCSVRGASRLTDAGIAGSFRKLVETVTVHPVPPRAPLDVEITGRLAELMEAPKLPPGARRYSGGSGGSGGPFHSHPPLQDARFRLRPAPTARPIIRRRAVRSA